MRCQKAYELISKKIDGELAFPEKEALRRHLEHCPACRESQTKLESDSLNLRRVFHFRRPDLTRFVRRTMAFLTEMEEPYRPAELRRPPRLARSPWFWVQTAGLAASILLLAYFYLVRDPQLAHEISRLERVLESRPSAEQLERTSDLARLDHPELDSLASQEADSPQIESGNVTETPESTTPTAPAEIVAEEGLSGPDAETIVSNLILAIDSGDLEAIQKWTDEVLRLHDESLLVFQRLVQSFDEETNEENKARILEVLAHFSTESSQAFYLDRLAEETHVRIRRGLVLGIYESLASGGQTAIFGVVPQLTQVFGDPSEDWKVRVYAGKALIREMILHDDVGILANVQRVVMESRDPRLRGEILSALAASETASGFESNIIEVLVDALTSETDFDATRKTVEGIENRLNTEGALRVIDQISRRVGDRTNLQMRLRRAQEMLETELQNRRNLDGQ